ncbi:uncharacterized protein LOC135333554 [Halichondria panicea]|uniref:uncharacterized protein LOC135333554 n=1 Tax=Halichondria panicea TaxID=6063 RepID=UPI00312B8EC4
MEFTSSYILLSAVLVLAALYYGWGMAKRAAKTLTELFLFIWLFNGKQIYHKTKRSLRMYTFNCETQYLDEVILEELYHFLTPVIQSDMKFTRSYPRWGKETPAHFKEIFKEYAESVKDDGDMYDEETGVLKQERSHLRENLLAVSEQDLQNPDIKYFVERNPGYLKGHCLVCGYRINWLDLFTTVFDQIMKKTSTSNNELKLDGPRRESVVAHQKSRPKLLRRITFQEQSANAIAANMYHNDLAGEVVLSSTNNFAFGFSPTHSSRDLPFIEL